MNRWNDLPAQVFVRAGEATIVTLTIDPRHYAVLQAQPQGPPSPTEPNGTWVPPEWVMKPATVTVHVGGQQPYSTPRLSSNVLKGGFKVEGDSSSVSRCPKYRPY